MKEFISVAEARELVLAPIRPLPSERVTLATSVGRTLAEPVIARENVPPFDNSAMDGYALRTSDLSSEPVELDVVGEIPAGTVSTTAIHAGACLRILTGAPVPDGADAVVPVEKTFPVNGGRRIRLEERPQPGDHIRRAGEDMAEGQEIIAAGSIVRAHSIAVLASLGYAEVPVTRRPRVAIVTTGSELVDVSEKPAPGQIRDSNGPTLAALVADAGGSVVGSFRAGDERSVLRERLEEAASSADMLIVTGGVSVGAYDFVREELQGIGVRPVFWKVRQRPGKPLAFGMLGKRAIFGLPGNPVSSSMCFEVYVRPVLERMLGRRQPTRATVPATLVDELPKRTGLHVFARGIARWEAEGLVVASAGAQGSHVSSALARANCIVHLPEDLDAAPAGTRVWIEWLD